MFEIIEHKVKERSKLIFDDRLIASHAMYKESLDTILGTLLEIELLLSTSNFSDIKRVAKSTI
jgi:hypothetical protein